MGDFIKKFPKQDFLDLLSSGLLESEALERVKMPKATYIQLQIKDPEFKDGVERAKKERADKWFEEIAVSTRKTLEKDEVAAEKLKFEQRKYLAAIDNPDKYAEKSKREIDVNVNIFQEMKELPVHEARKLLAQVDPFNIPIDTTFQNVTDDQTDNSPINLQTDNSPINLQTDKAPDDDIFS